MDTMSPTPDHKRTVARAYTQTLGMHTIETRIAGMPVFTATMGILIGSNRRKQQQRKQVVVLANGCEQLLGGHNNHRQVHM